MGCNTVFTGCVEKGHKQVKLRSADAVHQHSLKRAGRDTPGREKGSVSLGAISEQKVSHPEDIARCKATRIFVQSLALRLDTD